MKSAPVTTYVKAVVQGVLERVDIVASKEEPLSEEAGGTRTLDDLLHTSEKLSPKLLLGSHSVPGIWLKCEPCSYNWKKTRNWMRRR
jgi:hypothetical protein